YDPRWVVENQMGPNPLWLVEWLWPAVDLPPGSRVLDLGCGKALTSIFLAREYGVRVVAADLWVPPGDNWRRIRAAGCADTVLPVHTEAHDLRFAEEYFDAVVSIDAYEYFGTADTYLPYLARFVRPGGVVAIAEVGLTAELDDLPDHLRPYWRPDFWQWKSRRGGAGTGSAAAWWTWRWPTSWRTAGGCGCGGRRSGSPWTVTLPAAWPTCCAPTPAGTWGSSGSSPVPAEVPRQGVPYPDPVVALPVVEVLRVERCAAERAGTAKNLRVPERDAVVAMELNRLKDVLRARTVDPPSRQVADDGGHGVHVQ